MFLKLKRFDLITMILLLFILQNCSTPKKEVKKEEITEPVSEEAPAQTEEPAPVQDEEPVEEKKSVEIPVLDNVNFGLNESVSDSINSEIATRICEFLNQNSHGNLILHGYTCPIGTDRYNFDLSLKRSKYVFRFIKSNGNCQDLNRIKFVGHGEDEKFLISRDPNEYYKNRRVEFKFEGFDEHKNDDIQETPLDNSSSVNDNQELPQEPSEQEQQNEPIEEPTIIQEQGSDSNVMDENLIPQEEGEGEFQNLEEQD